MQCNRCRQRPPDPRGANEVLWSMPGGERLAEVLCTSCAAPLPPTNQTESLLRTLSALARCGLAGGAAPVLATERS